MRVVPQNGDQIDARIADDPRVSESQLAAIRRMADADPDATLIGLDQKMRPVVQARVGGSGGRVRTALMRNGDPAKPATPFVERWTGR